MVFLLAHTTFAVAAASFLFFTTALAGFDPSGSSNIAIYWGQNSYGAATGASNTQQRLAYYCSNTDIDIIPIAFLYEISTPVINFANADDNCTVFSGSTLLDCPQLEEDIQTCQSTYGKSIMLSVGGATYTEGGFSSTSAASAAADTIWRMFGPEQSDSSVNRPFGKAVVDGFDLDFESATSNMVTFASELRSKMDAATSDGGKSYYLSAAPQCPYPDIADNEMLAGEVSFDFIMVQFYNNYCGLQSYTSASTSQSSFNFGIWDTWAKTSSKNPDVRVLLGIPGSSTAAGSGYVSGSSLASIITYSKTFSSFGGVMVWDMTQVYANTGFLDLLADSLQSASSSASTTALVSATTSQLLTTSSTGWPASSTMSVPSYSTTSTLLSDTSSPATTASYVSSTKTTRHVYSSPAPSTMSTVTKSATSSSVSTEKDTGSCSTPSAAAVTSFITVTRSAALTATSEASKTSSSSTSVQSAVAQWGQCGGIGYSGSTECASPYTCVANSKWWAQCQ